MALEKQRSLGELNARLVQVEGGLFRAEYRREINPDHGDRRGDIPDVRVATSAGEVKIWVEQMALGLGYDRVVWEEKPD